MITRSIILASAMLVMTSQSSALIVVDGAPGGDADGLSPFETTQAAVKHAIASNDPIVEIQTNTPSGGVTIIPAEDFLQGPLTIRAGAGYSPSFSSPFVLNPATPNIPVALENIIIDMPPANNGAAIYAAGNLTLTSCTVKAIHQGGGHYPVAIKCNLRSPESNGVLNVTNSYIAGINGILAGHSIKDYNVTSSTLIGLTSDIDWASASPVMNIMNWETNDGGSLTNIIDSNIAIDVAIDAAGTTSSVTLAPIAQPRTLTLNQTICRSNGPQLAWPPSSLEGYGATYYGPANNNTIGPVVAKNCVFDGCNPVTIGSRFLEATQSPGSTFLQCTFRTSFGVTGAVRLRGNEAATHTISNCLIDSPAGIYGIGVDASIQANITVTGNGNVYCVKPGAEFVSLSDHAVPAVSGQLPPFESTSHTYAPPVTGGAYITTPDGLMYLPYGKNLTAAKAVPLTPTITQDMWGNVRPMPVGALASDVGAVEFDESINVMEAAAFDSSSPASVNFFPTTDDAVTYAVANSLDTVEVQVNQPTGGVAIIPAQHYLRKTLKIKAGSGRAPVFTNPLTINPANPGSTVTLENIDVILPPASNGAAVYAAGNVVLNNCNIEANHVGGGHYPVAIACNLRSPGQDGTLVLNDSYAAAHNAIVAGHSIKTYQLNDTTVVGLTSDLRWDLTGTVLNLMNWETNSGGSLTNLIDSSISIPVADANGAVANVQLSAITQPRTLQMNRCILRSNGSLLAWPPATLEFNGNYYYGAVNDNTIGPVAATNCVFDGCNPLMIGNPYLFDTQEQDCTFTHCTFRTTYGVTGAVRLHSIDPGTYTFTNCLFDSPQGLYGIGIEEAAGSNSVLGGNGNVYAIKPGVETVTLRTSTTLDVGPALPPFEQTYTYAPPADPLSFLTNPDGTLLISLMKSLAGGKAVALTPPLMVDLFKIQRPQPVGAASSDVGAVEFDETPSSGINDWTIF